MATKYNCECIKCGHKITTEKHCNDIKCSKCGGQMRRVERPGPGRNVMFNRNTNPADIPQDAFTFDMSGEGSFVASDDDKNNVRLKLYDGSVVKHYYWGNMAFDLEGIKLKKKRIPILYSHDTDKRLGFSTKASFDGEFILEGRLLEDSEEVRKIKADVLNGFPFEASLRFDANNIKLRYVKEGEIVEVNGRNLKGPGTVFLNTQVMEGSVCVFGLQNNCKTQVFEIVDNEDVTLTERENIMAEEKTEMTIEALKAEHSDIYKDVFDLGKTDGEKAERDMFTELAEVCGDDHELLVECFKEGKTKIEALQMKNAKLEEQRDEALANAGKAAETKTDPAVQEFSDEQTEPKKPEDDKPAKFMDAVAKYAAENKCSQAEAVDKCVDIYPELHKKMTEGKEE